MANDSKVQQQVLQLVAQSVTEFLRFLKARREFKLFEEDYKAADELLKLQMTIEDSPEDFMVVTVVGGKEDEFRRIMEDQGIHYVYANASYLEKFTGSYIIDKNDFQMIMSHTDILVHQEQPEFMEDEAELEDELGRKRPGTEDRDEQDADAREKQKDSPDQVLAGITARYTGPNLKDAEHVPFDPKTGTYTIPNEDVTVIATYDDGYERILASDSFTIENPEFDGNTGTYIGTVEYTENGITKTADFRVGSERELDGLDEAAEHELGASGEAQDEKHTDEKGKRNAGSDQSDDASAAVRAAEEAMRAADSANRAAMEQASMIAAQAAETAASAYQAAEAAAAAALVSEAAGIAVEAAETVAAAEVTAEVVGQTVQAAQEIFETDHSTDTENTSESVQPSDTRQGEPVSHTGQNETTPVYQDASFHEETYTRTEPASQPQTADDKSSYSQPENEEFSFAAEQKPASDNKTDNNNSGYERYENPTTDTTETGIYNPQDQASQAQTEGNASIYHEGSGTSHEQHTNGDQQPISKQEEKSEYPNKESISDIQPESSYIPEQQDARSEGTAYAEPARQESVPEDGISHSAPTETTHPVSEEQQGHSSFSEPNVQYQEAVPYEPQGKGTGTSHPAESAAPENTVFSHAEQASYDTTGSQTGFLQDDHPATPEPVSGMKTEPKEYSAEIASNEGYRAESREAAESNTHQEQPAYRSPKAESREAVEYIPQGSSQMPEGTEFVFGMQEHNQFKAADVSEPLHQADASIPFGQSQASDQPKAESREATGFMRTEGPKTPTDSEFAFGAQDYSQLKNPDVSESLYQTNTDTPFGRSQTSESPKAESREAAEFIRTEGLKAPEESNFAFGTQGYSQLKNSDVSEVPYQTDAGTPFGRPQASEPPKAESREATGFMKTEGPKTPTDSEFAFDTQNNSQFQSTNVNNQPFRSGEIKDTTASSIKESAQYGVKETTRNPNHSLNPEDTSFSFAQPVGTGNIKTNDSAALEQPQNPFRPDYQAGPMKNNANPALSEQQKTTTGSQNISSEQIHRNANPFKQDISQPAASQTMTDRREHSGHTDVSGIKTTGTDNRENPYAADFTSGNRGQTIPEAHAAGGLKESGTGTFREGQISHVSGQPQNSISDEKTGLGNKQSGSTGKQGNPFAPDFAPNKPTDMVIKPDTVSRMPDAEGFGTKRLSDLKNTEDDQHGVGVKDRPDSTNTAADKEKTGDNPFKPDFSKQYKPGDTAAVGKETDNLFSNTEADRSKIPLADVKTGAPKGAVNIDNRIRDSKEHSDITDKFTGDTSVKKDGVSITFGKDALKGGKDGKLQPGTFRLSGKQGDEGMSFEDRIRSSMELGDGKIKVATNQMGSASDMGLHDTFNKALMKAFASVIDEDSGMTKGIRMVQNKSMLAGLNAASSVMVAPLVQETMKRISMDLSTDEIRVFGDIIKRNNFGKFDMDEPTLWQESLESYRKMLTKAGVLQSRDGGRTSMTIGKDIRRKGTKSERDLIKKKAKITGHMKESLSQKEKAIDYLITEFAKSGKTLTKKGAADLVDRLYSHSAKVADVTMLMSRAKGALKSVTSFGLFDKSLLNNTLFMQGLKDDPSGQGLFAAKSIISMSQMVPDGFMSIMQYRWLSESEKYAKKIAALDEQLSSGNILSGANRSSLLERKNMLEQQKAKVAQRADKWKARRDKFSQFREKVGNKLKAPERKLKKATAEGLKKGISKVPGGDKVLAAAENIRKNMQWQVFMESHPGFAKALTTVFGKPLQLVSKAQAALAKASLAVAKFIAAYVYTAFKTAIMGGLILAPLIIIVSFTTTNTDDADAETTFASTLGLAYESMQEMESNWVANIKQSAEAGKSAYIDEFYYTRVNEALGEIDENHRNEEPSAYVPAVLGTEYKPGGLFSHGQIKGPEPWPDAPEEAYKWISIIDGGVEMRFLGTGGYPGYTSNLMDICAMAAVAQQQSSLTEIDDAALEIAASDGVFDLIKNGVTAIVSGIKTAISAMGKALCEAMPGLDSFLTKTKENERARVYMAYCKPLFDQSHQMEFGLEMSLLPTMRTLWMDGAGNISSFSTTLGEGLSDTSYSSADAITTEEQEANAKYIWDWLINKGLSEYQAAGILGNMQGESDMNPGLHEAGKAWEYGGLGLCQWTRERRRLFEAYMAARGTDWKTDIEGQLMFLFYGDDEFDRGILQTYINTNYTQVADATQYFYSKWERPAATDTSLEKRIKYAIKYKELFAGTDVSSCIIDLDNVTSSSTETAKEYVTHYSHTSNIDDDGNQDGGYQANLNTDDVVTVDGAEQITIEVWCSTKSKSSAHLEIFDGEGNSVSGTLGGGAKTSQPDNSSIYYNTYTVDGDTATFHFESNNSSSAKSYYGYYAIIKDMDADKETTSVTLGTTTYSKVTVTKYSHTDNLDDDGNQDGAYSPNMETDDVITIDGAEELNIEVWCSTKSKSSAHLEIFDKDGDSVSGTLGGGSKTTKPADSTSYHHTYTVDGDTATFHFESNNSNSTRSYYGYYAIITGETITTETSDEAQANIEEEQEGSLNQVLYNVDMCTDTDHGGYGCMSYSGFYYNDTERNYLYYPNASESRIDVVQPAAEIDSNKWACNAPDGTSTQFYEALDHNPGCWDCELIYSTPMHGENYKTTQGSSYLNKLVSKVEGYTASGTPSKFTVTIDYNYKEDDDTDDEGDKVCHCTFQRAVYVFTHNCKGTHTGYYCGGHLKLIVYGLVYHITKAERESNQDLYKDKVESIGAYYKNASDPGVLRERIRKAEDLFDIDMGIIHVDKSVADDFEGWTYDNIADAVLKLEDDWEDLYGIQTSYTIAGINGVSGSTGTISTASMVAHIKAVMDQIRDEDTRNLRLQALVTAFTYVGQIGYDQSAHGSPLTIGGLNDCSGYASRVWENVFYSRIYTTETFKDLAIEYGAYHEYSDGQIQPGDILLHGMQTSSTDDNHALIYVGVEDGTVMSIDCSSPTAQYRSRGESYYNSATYIDMNIFIRAYLSEHPEADEEPDVLSGNYLLSGVSSGVSVDVSNLTIPNLALNYEGGLPIVYYAQGSGSPWASVPFGGGTIATSGCSVTSLAMVLTYLKCGSDVSDAEAIITPDEVVATIAANNGGNYNKFYVDGAGQSWDIFPAVASYYGVNCAQINSGSIIASLQAGRPVIMSCKPGIFTSGGHFIVLTGYDATTGLIYVNDPNGSHASYSLTGYSLSVIKSQGKGWWSFWN